VREFGTGPGKSKYKSFQAYFIHDGPDIKQFYPVFSNQGFGREPEESHIRSASPNSCIEKHCVLTHSAIRPSQQWDATAGWAGPSPMALMTGPFSDHNNILILLFHTELWNKPNMVEV